MARVLCVLCSSLIIASLYHHVTAQPQRRRPKPSPPFAGFGSGPPSSSSSQIRLRGLCRDGWKESTSQDLYGNEIPICIKINDKAQTWDEAKDTCRQDFGFLLKLDSPINVDGNDLMSLVLSKGITNIWTGAHTDNSHLIWDDLVPTQLKPNNFNRTDLRPWRWSDENPNKLSEYCGKLSIDQDDEDKKKKRKKRQILNFDTSESDSNDRLFGSSDSLFGQSSEGSQSTNDGYPQASAFQEMLARTQFNDRLAELPTAALGVPSAQQLPGSGLSGRNLQKGGLATVSPLYSQTTVHSDGDSDKDVSQPNSHDFLKNAGNLGFQTNNNGHNINPQAPRAFNQGAFNQGDLFNQPNPTVASSLVGSVKDHVEKLGIGSDLQGTSPTEMLETLTEQLNEGMQSNENVMLTALNQLKGNSNPDTISNGNLNMASPGMRNVNPTAKTGVNPKIKPQNILHLFKNQNPTINQDLLSPTTVSPFMNTFIGQENQNSDDSTSLSETIRDLLHGITSPDSSQKDLSDSAKAMLQGLQPTMPSHSETLEALSDKISDIKNAGLTTPATYLFNDNFQLNDKADDSDTNRFSAIDPISNSNDFPDKLTDVQKEILSTDKLLSDEKKKLEIPSLVENDDRISETLKSVSDSRSETITDNNNLKILHNDPNPDHSNDDDRMGNLEKTIAGIPFTENTPSVELTETLDLKSTIGDIMSNSDDLDKKDILSNTDILDTLNSNLAVGADDADDTDNVDKTNLQALPTAGNPILPESVSDLKTKDDSDELLQQQTANDDSNVLNPSTNDDGNLNDMVENMVEKQNDMSSDNILKDSLPTTEDLGTNIAENLKDYLSLTKPNSDMDDDSNDAFSVGSTGENVSVAADKERISDDNDDLEKATQSETDKINEPQTESSIQDTVDDIKSLGIVNPSEDVSDITAAEISDLAVNENDDSVPQVPILETDETDDSAGTVTTEDDQTPILAGDSEDQVEELLKEFKRNTTDVEADDNENTDTLVSEPPETNEVQENSSGTQTVTIDDGEELDTFEPTGTILTNEDTISDMIDDIASVPDSETEETVNDGSDLLENYNKLLGNNKLDTDINDDGITEDIDVNTETVEGKNEIENDTSEKTEVPDESNKSEIAEADDIIEKVEEIMDNKADKSLDDSLDDMPTLAEALSPENEKTAILPSVGDQEMELLTCRQKMPSVCFSYQLEVKSRVSTCEKGWYGHILHNKCYRILTAKQNYRQAAARCQALGAYIVAAESEFERTFTLLAVSLDGQLFRGTKFWKQSSQKRVCQYYDETGIKEANNCDRALNVICEKQARHTDVVANNYPDDTEEKFYMIANKDAVLPCGLTTSTHELPVMWFKDGLLVSTITSDDSEDPSLLLNRDLINMIRLKTNRDMSMAALQGRYWCEVWDTRSNVAETVDAPIRRRSNSYDIRFSDVMSFHGSVALNQFSYKDEALFNLMGQTFPSLAAMETDLKRVFRDVLPVLRGTLDYVSGVYTHVDRVRSSPRVLEYHTYISLTKNYTNADEIEVYNRLKGLLRAVLGNAQYMSNLPGKTPVTTFRTMALQSTTSCPAAELRTNSIKTMAGRVFKFRHSLLGEKADSNETCSASDLRPAGSARCLGDFYTGAYWGDVSANDCTPFSDEEEDDEEDNLNEDPIDAFNEDIWGKTPQTDTLTEMAKTKVNEGNVENVTGTVAKITSDALTFTPTDINKIADVLEHTAGVEKVTEEVGRNVINTVDKLMTLSEKEVEVANVETKAANRIIKSLEKCAEKVDMKDRDNFRLVTDNIAMEVWMLKDDSRPVIGLAAHTDEVSPKKVFKAKDIATVFNKSQLFDANVDAAIELPKEAFAPKVKGQPARNKLTMMVFRKSKLFEMAAKSSDGRALNMNKNDISQLNSYVISASIAGKKLTGLKERVRTIFKPLKEDGSNQNCVFWDFNLNEKKGGWSSEGCIYDGRINGREVCLCDHLTNFAVLLDFYGQENPIHPDHELSLSIITIIGLSFSILGLALTIVSFVFFKKLRQGRAQQTLFNLAVALLCAMLVFLIGIKQTHHYWLCLIGAVMLHYFVLASFMWMLMEAILQYLTFVKILGTYITRFTLKTVIPAWGLPLVPVIIILSLDYTLYKGGDEYCWMSLPAFYYGFVVPISCIIVTNIIIFIITIISIFRRGKGLRSNQKKKKVAITNLQAAITSFILLGLSWLFGYLAIADARLPFQYIFTILNSLQGFFIFILFVVRKKKVRDQWYIICCKGMDKEKVSRSLSASNSIPSSYSNGSSSRKNSKCGGKERDRSDSTKTVTSSLSSAGSFSNGYTNLGYDSSFDRPYSRRAYRNF